MFGPSQPNDFYFLEAIQQQGLGFPVLLLTANATWWARSLCLEQGTQKTVTVRLTDIVAWNKQTGNLKNYLSAQIIKNAIKDNARFAKGFLLGITSKPTDVQQYDCSELRQSGIADMIMMSIMFKKIFN
jgi:hypothetical protein